MPAAPRYNKQGTKIAYSVMGIPQNIKFKRSAWQKYVNKMLISQESSRVK
jgi:hypothetical protein